MNSLKISDTIRPRVRALTALICIGAVMTALTVATGTARAAATLPAAEIPEVSAPVNVEPVVTRELEIYTEPEPYSTVVVYDETRWSDEVAVLQSGQDGMRRTGLVTVYEDGCTADSYEISTVTLQPVDEIVSVGAIPGSRTDSRGYYIWPTTGKVSSGYGRRSVSVGSSNHKGLDIANRVGTDVWAADSGTVIYAANWKGSGYGNIIKIEHDNGDITYYAHLSKILVSEGDRVVQGDLIAKMGSTGNVTGPHLHFELRPNGGDPVDPASYLTGELSRG